MAEEVYLSGESRPSLARQFRSLGNDEVYLSGESRPSLANHLPIASYRLLSMRAEPMANGKYIAYYRVSTDRQEKSGLGLGAQQTAVRSYLNGGDWKLVGEYTEAESGKRTDRPELEKALAQCRVHNATLIVAKLDRLARNTRFLLKVRDESGERGVVFCDFPIIPEGAMGKYMVTNMAAMAELEAGLTSQRTKAALQAAKARGKVLGCKNDNIRQHAHTGAKASAVTRTANASSRASDLLPAIKDLQASGITSYRGIAFGLNGKGIQTAQGKEWSAVQVRRILERVGANAA